MYTCFQSYYQPVYMYIKKAFSLAFDNDCKLFYSSLSMAAVSEFLTEFFKINYFGVTNGLLLWIVATVLVDAWYGIKKSIKQSKAALLEASEICGETPEKKMLLKKHELKKFNPLKLQFTFFKILTLFAYLYFAKHILTAEDDGGIFIEIIGIASGVVIKAPLAIFWYYDFKSIGDNLEFLLGKKPPIFNIVEKIFEPKIGEFFNKNKDYE